MQEYLHKHIAAVALLVLVLGGVVFVFVHEHNNVIREQAERDEFNRQKSQENQQLKDQNKLLADSNVQLKQQMDTLATTTRQALATIEQQKQSITNSQQAIVELNKLLRDRGLAPVATDPSGNATISKDNLIDFTRQALQCKADATELSGCKATVQVQAKQIENDDQQIKNDKEIIANKDEQLAKAKGPTTMQKVKHDGKVILIWEVVKAGLRAIFKGGGIKF